MRKTISFEQSLEYCLQELERAGDVEASLGRYPQHADQLRPLLETVQAARQHYRVVPQAPGGLAAGRERMLAEAARQRARGSFVPALKTGRKTWRISVMRLVTALLVAALGVISLGGGTIWAASDSLPGDFLYPLKLATEDARLTLASGPEKQVGLELQFIKERADEIRELAADGQAPPDETIARLERHIEHALTQAQAAGEEKDKLLLQIIEHTRTQAHRLEQALAPASVQAGLAHAMMVCQQGTIAAESALDAPTPEPPRVTAIPKGTQESSPTLTRTYTPRATPQSPSLTPQGPQATSSPRATSNPRATPQVPRVTSSPRVTSGPQATPPVPQGTPSPSATPPGPRGTPPDPTATPKPQATSPGIQSTPSSPTATPEPRATRPGPQGTSPGPKGTSQGP
jgi:hypothetical protein